MVSGRLNAYQINLEFAEMMMRFLGDFEGILQTGFPATGLRRWGGDGRLCGLRPCRRTEDGACRLLGPCPAEVRRSDQTQQAGPGLDADPGADRKVVCHRRPGAGPTHGPCSTSRAAHETGLVGAHLNQGADRASRSRGIAFEPARQGFELHSTAVGQAHALPRLPRAGAIQQSRRELDAPHRTWPPQLDPRRTCKSRTTRGRHPVHRRNLQTNQHTRP